MTAVQGSGGAAASEAEVDSARVVWVMRNGSRRISDATIRAMLDAAASARPAPAGEAAPQMELLSPLTADRIAYLNRALAAEIDARTAAEAALAQARADALEEAAKVADQHWDGMVVPEARGASEIAADIRALTPTDGGAHDHR